MTLQVPEIAIDARAGEAVDAAVKAELAAFRALLADRLWALSRPAELFDDELVALQPEDVAC